MYSDILWILLAVLLVAVNGFFVAAEFAFIKARPYRLEDLVRKSRPFARTAVWLQKRLDGTLAACQLGITMASLALGWVGEPAVAHLITPLFRLVGIESAAVLHAVAFVFAFSIITAAHLIAGEQVPKILAIRRPEKLALRCAPVMKAFYVCAFPFLWALSSVTTAVLEKLGVVESSGHETPHTEGEIRALLAGAQVTGELSKSEHRMLQNVFEFDDTICRRIMLPRGDVEFFKLDQPVSECMEVARRTKHTRYPVCESSLDDVVGVLHIKDLAGVTDFADVDLESLLRPPHRVSETMPITRLLRHFQAVRQHMAFVVDEYGNVIGLVFLETVLEQIVGSLQDEFDLAQPLVVPDGGSNYLVTGSAPIGLVNKQTGLVLADDEADTLSGLATTILGRIPQVGDRIEVDDAVIEVLEVASSRATKMRVRVGAPVEELPTTP